MGAGVPGPGPGPGPAYKLEVSGGRPRKGRKEESGIGNEGREGQVKLKSRSGPAGFGCFFFLVWVFIISS